jgi:uncharacterized membrane protein YoaK (UPF0700 family)
MRLSLPSKGTSLSALAPMLALTFTTGVVDAVGYLGLDRVFTGNMTGNVVILGMALAGSEGLPIVGPLIALAAFLAGALAAGRVLRGTPDGWTARITSLLVASSAMMLALGVVMSADGDPSRAVALSVTGLLGAAMGLQGATARVVAVKDVTTVVVTSTLISLASESPLGRNSSGGAARRAIAVIAIAAGAIVGAGVLQWQPGAALLLAAVVSIAATWWGHLYCRSHTALEDLGVVAELDARPADVQSENLLG